MGAQARRASSVQGLIPHPLDVVVGVVALPEPRRRGRSQAGRSRQAVGRHAPVEHFQSGELIGALGAIEVENDVLTARPGRGTGS